MSKFDLIAKGLGIGVDTEEYLNQKNYNDSLRTQERELQEGKSSEIWVDQSNPLKVRAQLAKKVKRYYGILEESRNLKEKEDIYSKEKGLYTKDMEELLKLVGEGDALQAQWNEAEWNEVGKAHILKPGTWKHVFRAITNLYPEGDELNKESKLYKSIYANLEKQGDIKTKWQSSDPYQSGKYTSGPTREDKMDSKLSIKKEVAGALKQLTDEYYLYHGSKVREDQEKPAEIIEYENERKIAKEWSTKLLREAWDLPLDYKK